MLCKADFPIFPLPECLCFFLYLIRLEFPVDLVMCLFHHTCLSTSQKWGNKCSQEKYPLPCLKRLDICSILISPQASLPSITLLLLFFFHSQYIWGTKYFNKLYVHISSILVTSDLFSFFLTFLMVGPI